VATSNIKEDEEEFNADASLGGMINIIVDPLVTGLISKSTGGDILDLEGILYDIAHYMSKVPLDRITEFETAQRQLEAVQLVASRERAGLADRDKLTSRDKSVDLSAFKLSCLFFSLLSSGSLVVGDRMGFRYSTMSFLSFMLNLAFSGDLTIDAATRYDTRASIPTLSMLLYLWNS
nr:hypothetical protein [Tanacetum cinerariifolium]